jgi:hypothetical protein
MQKKEVKGFFFNSVFKRPIILRSLLRGQGHQPREELVRGERGAGGQSNTSTPFTKGGLNAREEGDMAKRICGL